MNCKTLKLAVFLTVTITLLAGDCFACTSAIFTGKVTADGRPLLWKHRDTDDENNHIAYFQGEKYSFLALQNSSDTIGTAWTGTNSAGFSIMNTASYNLKDDREKLQDMEGALMYRALSVCKNLQDFEKFLDEYPRPMGVEANFGVIDAEGGAAYYEVNNTRWVKVDANDPKVAPNGYLVYTNFSYTGRYDDVAGYERYLTASEIIAAKAPERNFTPVWIFNSLSRSFRHAVLGIDLKDEAFSPERGSGYTVDQDYIPRKITSASIVIQGVKPEENPETTIMWTVLGYPPAGIALPLWVKAGADQPAIVMRTKTSSHAEVCDAAVALKKTSYPIVRGNGSKYLYFTSIYNKSGSGYMQRLAPYETRIFGLYAKHIDKWRKTGTVSLIELKSLNYQAVNIIREGYKIVVND